MGIVGGALMLTAGRGFAPPNAGPANQAMKPAAYGVTTEAEARAGVLEQVKRGVDIIKIWVDDRGGTVPKLSPDLVRVIVEEAHRHATRVIAHVYYLADAKALVELGVDGFAHLPRDLPVDEALATAMKARDVFVLPNLAVSENGTHLTPPAWLDDPLLKELVGTPELERLRASYSRRTTAGVERSAAIYKGMQQSVARLKAAGVFFGFGSDAGAVQDHFHAFTDHRELQLMVEAGLTPMDAIVAATRNSATILRQVRRGVIERRDESRTSSCWMRTRLTTSRIPRGSRASTCAARPWTAPGCARHGPDNLEGRDDISEGSMDDGSERGPGTGIGGHPRAGLRGAGLRRP